MTVYPFDPPVDANLWCRHCGDRLLATGLVRVAGLVLRGLQEYQWTHAHGSDTCLPKTTAQPFDGWQATSKVGAVLAAREAAADALIAAMEDAR